MIETIGVWGLIIGVIVLLFIILYFIPIGLWFSALGIRRTDFTFATVSDAFPKSSAGSNCACLN